MAVLLVACSFFFVVCVRLELFATRAQGASRMARLHHACQIRDIEYLDLEKQQNSFKI